MHLNRLHIETSFFFFPPEDISLSSLSSCLLCIFFNDSAVGIEDEYLVIS